MSQDVFERLRTIVCDRLDISPELFTDDASFIENLGADSLDVVDLVMHVEAEFNFEIPDDDYLHFATVRQAVDYIALHQGQGAANKESAATAAAE